MTTTEWLFKNTNNVISVEKLIKVIVLLIRWFSYVKRILNKFHFTFFLFEHFFLWLDMDLRFIGISWAESPFTPKQNDHLFQILFTYGSFSVVTYAIEPKVKELKSYLSVIRPFCARLNFLRKSFLSQIAVGQA